MAQSKFVCPISSPLAQPQLQSSTETQTQDSATSTSCADAQASCGPVSPPSIHTGHVRVPSFSLDSQCVFEIQSLATLPCTQDPQHYSGSSLSNSHVSSPRVTFPKVAPVSKDFQTVMESSDFGANKKRYSACKFLTQNESEIVRIRSVLQEKKRRDSAGLGRSPLKAGSQGLREIYGKTRGKSVSHIRKISATKLLTGKIDTVRKPIGCLLSPEFKSKQGNVGHQFAMAHDNLPPIRSPVKSKTRFSRGKTQKGSAVRLKSFSPAL